MAIGPVMPQVPPDTGPARRPEAPGTPVAQPVAAVGAVQPQLARQAPLPVALQDPAAARVRAQLAAVQAERGATVPRGETPGAAPRRAAVALAEPLLRLLALLAREGAINGKGDPQAPAAWPQPGRPPQGAPAASATPATPGQGAAPLAREPVAAWRQLTDALARSGLPGAAPAADDAEAASTTAAGAAGSSPAPAPVPAQAGAWGAERLRDALQYLLTGQLAWAGEFTPGVLAEVRREDAWQQDPQAPDRLLAGAAVVMSLELPQLGRLTLRAQQCAGSCAVTLDVSDDSRAQVAAALPDLRERLARLAEPPQPRVPAMPELRLRERASPPRGPVAP